MYDFLEISISSHHQLLQSTGKYYTIVAAESCRFEPSFDEFSSFL